MHCIKAVIVDKENLQLIQEKIKTVYSKKLVDNNHTEFFAIPIDEFPSPEVYLDDDIDDKLLNHLKKILGQDITYAIVETNYFGGCGEQSAIIVNKDKVTYCEFINVALFHIGVVKNHNDDEFDIINLGNYRSNIEFYPKDKNEIIDILTKDDQEEITLTKRELLKLIHAVKLNISLDDKIKTFLKV